MRIFIQFYLLPKLGLFILNPMYFTDTMKILSARDAS